MDERRVNPEDGKAYSFKEMESKYFGQPGWRKKKIKAHWDACPPVPKIEIQVTPVTGDALSLNVDPGIQCYQVKDLIQEMLGIDPRLQRIVWNKMCLEHTQELSEVGVEDGATLVLVVLEDPVEKGGFGWSKLDKGLEISADGVHATCKVLGLCPGNPMAIGAPMVTEGVHLFTFQVQTSSGMGMGLGFFDCAHHDRRFLFSPYRRCLVWKWNDWPFEETWPNGQGCDSQTVCEEFVHDSTLKFVVDMEKGKLSFEINGGEPSIMDLGRAYPMQEGTHNRKLITTMVPKGICPYVEFGRVGDVVTLSYEKQ